MKIKEWEVVKGRLPFLCPYGSRTRPPITAPELLPIPLILVIHTPQSLILSLNGQFACSRNGQIALSGTVNLNIQERSICTD